MFPASLVPAAPRVEAGEADVVELRCEGAVGGLVAEPPACQESLEIGGVLQVCVTIRVDFALGVPAQPGEQAPRCVAAEAALQDGRAVGPPARCELPQQQVLLPSGSGPHQRGARSEETEVVLGDERL
jgi:hypothetical protein